MNKLNREQLAQQIALWIAGERGMFRHPLEPGKPISYAQVLANPLLLRTREGRVFNFAPPVKNGMRQEDPAETMARSFSLATKHVLESMEGKTLAELFQQYHWSEIDGWDPVESAELFAKKVGIDPHKPLSDFVEAPTVDGHKIHWQPDKTLAQQVPEFVKESLPKYGALLRGIKEYAETVGQALNPLAPPNVRAEAGKEVLMPVFEALGGLASMTWELVRPPVEWKVREYTIDLERVQQAYRDIADAIGAEKEDEPSKLTVKVPVPRVSGKFEKSRWTTFADLLTFGGYSAAKQKYGEADPATVMGEAAKGFLMGDLAEMAAEGSREAAKKAGAFALVNIIPGVLGRLRPGRYVVEQQRRQIGEAATQIRNALPNKDVLNAILDKGDEPLPKVEGTKVPAPEGVKPAEPPVPEGVKPPEPPKPPVQEEVKPPEPPVQEGMKPTGAQEVKAPEAQEVKPAEAQEGVKPAEGAKAPEETKLPLQQEEVKAPPQEEAKAPLKEGEKAPPQERVEETVETSKLEPQDPKKELAKAAGVHEATRSIAAAVAALDNLVVERVLATVAQEHPNLLAQVSAVVDETGLRPSYAALKLIRETSDPAVQETVVRVLRDVVDRGEIKDFKDALEYFPYMEEAIKRMGQDLERLKKLFKDMDAAKVLQQVAVALVQRYDDLRHGRGFFKRLAEELELTEGEAAKVAAFVAKEGVSPARKTAAIRKLLDKAGVSKEEAEFLASSPEFVRATSTHPPVFIKAEDVPKLVKEAGENKYIHPAMVILGDDPYKGVPLSEVPAPVRAAVAWKRREVEAIKPLVPERVPGIPAGKVAGEEALKKLAEGEPSEAMKWVYTLTAALQSMSAGFSLSHYRTAARNFTSAFLNTGMDVVSRALTGVASMAFNRDFGVDLLRRAVEDLAMLGDGQARKGLLDVLDRYRGVWKIVRQTGWTLERALAPSMTDFLTPEQKKVLHFAEVVSRGVSVFNSVSDTIVKIGLVAADAEHFLRELGVKAGVGDDGRPLTRLVTAATSPEYFEQLSEALAYALHRAKKMTFTLDPPTDSLAHKALQLMGRYPVLKLLTTNFPRFVYNSVTWFMDHQLTNAFDLLDPKFRKMLTSEDPLTHKLAQTHLANSMGGFLMLSMAYAQMEKQNPPKYYQIYMGKDEKTGNETYFDYRNLGPFANFAFMAHLARVAEGKARLNMTKDELFQALTSLSKLDDQLATKLESVFTKLAEAEEGREGSLERIVQELVVQPLYPFSRPLGMVVKDMVLPLMDAMGMRGPEWFTDVVGKPEMSQVPIDVKNTPLARVLTPILSPEAINRFIGDPANHVAYMTDIFASRENPFVGVKTPLGRAMRMLGFQTNEYTPIQEALHKLGVSHHKYIPNFYNVPAERQYVQLISRVFDTPAILGKGEEKRLSPVLKKLFGDMVPPAISSRVLKEEGVVTVGDVVAKLLLDEQYQNWLYNYYNDKVGREGYKLDRRAIPDLMTKWFLKHAIKVADEAYSVLENIVTDDMSLPARRLTLTGAIEMNFKESLEEYFKQRPSGPLPSKYLEKQEYVEPPPKIDYREAPSPIARLRELVTGQDFEALLDAWDRATMNAPPQWAVAMKGGSMVAKLLLRLEKLGVEKGLITELTNALKRLQEANPKSSVLLNNADKMAQHALNRIRGYLVRGAKEDPEEAVAKIEGVAKKLARDWNSYAKKTEYAQNRAAKLKALEELGYDLKDPNAARFADDVEEAASSNVVNRFKELQFLRDAYGTPKQVILERMVDNNPNTLFTLINKRSRGERMNLEALGALADPRNRVKDGEFLIRARMVLSRLSAAEERLFMEAAKVSPDEYKFMAGKVRAADRLEWNKAFNKDKREKIVRGLMAVLKERMDTLIAKGG